MRKEKYAVLERNDMFIFGSRSSIVQNCLPLSKIQCTKYIHVAPWELTVRSLSSALNITQMK